ncbi:MAG: LCP family protein, partial [Acidimicrobiia bacterium]
MSVLSGDVVRKNAPKSRKIRRTWPQRMVIVFNLGVAMACLGGALALNYGRDTVNSITRVKLTPGVLDPTGVADGTDATFIDSSGFSTAENWLITGTDARSKDNCGISPDSPYAGAFGKDGIGDRSDTIMVMRIDPNTNFAAMLSFPRDLWVKIGGTKRSDRINAAFDPTNPERLIQTVKENFNIPINHYASIGFCGFKDLVDALGGVQIPFDRYVRDKNTGFATGIECKELNGEAALAYARSRHLQTSTDGKKWKEDGASDWSRIRRQQDLIKRIGQKLADAGIATNPGRLNAVVKAAVSNIDIEEGVAVKDLLKLATRMRNLDPATIRTFTVSGTGSVQNGSSVIMYRKGNTNNENVFKVFRGEATP